MKKFLIAIPILFLAAACNSQTAQVQPVQSQPVQNQSAPQPAQVQPQQPQATTTDETANWKTFTSKYGYTVKYPDGWQIYDSSSSNPVYNQKYGAFIGFGINGPWRTDLPGSNGKAQFNAGVSYHSDQNKFILDENTISFVYPQQPQAQAPSFVNLDSSYIKNTPEYQTAQAIANTAQLIK